MLISVNDTATSSGRRRRRGGRGVSRGNGRSSAASDANGKASLPDESSAPLLVEITPLEATIPAVDPSPAPQSTLSTSAVESAAAASPPEAEPAEADSGEQEPRRRRRRSSAAAAD